MDKNTPIFCDVCKNTVVRKPLKNSKGKTWQHVCPICGSNLSLTYRPHIEQKQKCEPYRADYDYHGKVLE